MRILAGVMLALAIEALLVSVVAFSGVLDVGGDQTPGPVERAAFSYALRASVVRRAGREYVPPASTPDATRDAVEAYGALCARCHGEVQGPEGTAFGKSFDPPAPRLPGHATTWGEPELAWIIKHGIRNTAMPAWRAMLSDDEIGNLSALVKSFGLRAPIP